MERRFAAMSSLALFVAILHATAASPHDGIYFGIRVVDSQTGLGVPMVRLSTSTYITLYTDSAGAAAFFEPGMMDQTVWFSVLTEGYSFPLNSDPPYDPGLSLLTTSGGTATINLTRTQVAQRMFRLTGSGLYRDSVLLGWGVPTTALPRALSDPATASAAQDTVHTNTFQNQVFWTFGDTDCVSDKRQGNCHSTGMYTVGAQSRVHPSVAADPPELHYFGSNGTIHPMAPIEPLQRNTWISALSVLSPQSSSESLFATYIKPSTGGGPDPHEYEGVAQWNTSTLQFEQRSRWPAPGVKKFSLNGAHTVILLSENDSKLQYTYFANSGVYARVKSNPNDIVNYSAYEVLSADLAWLPVASSEGNLTGAPHQQAMRRDGVMVDMGGGTVNWNPWTGKYLFVGTGDAVFMAFADQIEGPWVNVTMVASHQQTGSSCYNGAHLPHMDLDGGRVVHLACTYTAMWSNGGAGQPGNSWSKCLFGLNGSKAGCASVVPRYEYNNLIYRVDLSIITSPKP